MRNTSKRPGGAMVTVVALTLSVAGLVAAGREARAEDPGPTCDYDAKPARPEAHRAKAVPVAAPAEATDSLRVAVRPLSVRRKPSEKARVVRELPSGAEVTLVTTSKNQRWAKIVDGNGRKGWVRTQDLAVRTVNDDDEAEDDDEDDEDDDAESKDEDDDDDDDDRATAATASSGDGDDGDGAPRRTTAHKRARRRGATALGAYASMAVLRKQQHYRSENDAANYHLANTKPFVQVSARLGVVFGALGLGLEAGAGATVGEDGVEIVDGITSASAQNGEVFAWSAAEVHVRGHAAYVFGDGYQLECQLGYRVASISVDYTPTAMVPSERLAGPTVGAGFAAPRLVGGLGASLGVDYLVGGTLEQTENMQDGDDASVSAFYVTAEGTYAITSVLGLRASYQLSYETFAWSGANRRYAAAANPRRDDLQHLFGLGLAFQF